MKKYFVIATIVSLICNISIANNWNLLKSGKRWNIIQITYNPNMVNHDSITYFVKFEGDTTINSHNYLCVYQATNHEFGNKILNGFVREDSEIGMYFRSLQGNEGLLYKYNMHAGDSVTIANLSAWGDSIRYFVADIDSIQIDDKYMRKYTMIQDDYEHMPETWIEGVGSSLGILNSGMVSAGGTTSLLCCFDNNVLIYKNPNYQDCYCSTHTALQSIVKSESEINVYFGNQNIVSIKSPIDNYVKIFNSYGMLVGTIHVLANQEYNLNTSKYSKGIYVISPTTNLFKAKKIIVY